LHVIITVNKFYASCNLAGTGKVYSDNHLRLSSLNGYL